MMAVSYKAVDIARWIVAGVDRDAGDSITPLKLQKLLYYAQAWALVFLGRPLFADDFEAWAHGPVVEAVYQEYRRYGWDSIPFPDSGAPVLDAETAEHIETILGVYGDSSAKHLEQLTHLEAPWRNARGSLAPAARSNSMISKNLMKEYYTSLYEQVDVKQKQDTKSSEGATAASGVVTA